MSGTADNTTGASAFEPMDVNAIQHLPGRRPDGMHLVFTYGTLKRGEPNHHVMTNEDTGKSEFVTEGCTTVAYPLVIASRYNIPFLLDKKDVGNPVHGEIWAVDDRKLVALDELESHPTYYQRRLERIQWTYVKKQQSSCWTYFLPKFRPELLEYDMMTNYSSTGDHGKVYVASEDDIESESELYD